MSVPTSTPPPEHATPPELADPQAFRDPTPREHWLAAGLFWGFGLFFVLLFFVTAGFWFRWVTLGIGVYSLLHGVRHVGHAVRRARP
jgi:hypothetical protein